MHSESSNIDYFRADVQRIWLYNRRVVVYRVPQSTPEAMRVWLEVATETGVHWPRDQRYYGLHDFSQTYISINPRVYAGAVQMAHRTRHLDGYFAGAVQRTSMAMGIKQILDINIMPVVPTLQMSLFFSYDEALAWLVSNLD